MPNNRVLQGNDLGLIIGGSVYVTPGGIFVYKPQNDLIPNSEMSNSELQLCLGEVTLFANIPYSRVRQVYVNDTSIWKNQDCFDLRALGINPLKQDYWGRGNVSVEFRDDANDVGELVERILKKGMGLSRK